MRVCLISCINTLTIVMFVCFSRFYFFIGVSLGFVSEMAGVYWSRILFKNSGNFKSSVIELVIGEHTTRKINFIQRQFKTTSSEVLTRYLIQCEEPPWTSYFVKYIDIKDDQWGKSHFNWKAGTSNYHILRTGCFPYIKYHCSKRPEQNLVLQDYFFRFIKVLNLGIPCLAYGIAATFLIRHTEVVNTSKGAVNIYFLYEEHKGSHY